MYKLIALDLDGTLTDKNKNILEETKQELIKLAQKGVIIVLASGRPTAGIFKEAKELTNRKEQIRILDNGEIYMPAAQTYGRDANSILREVMKVSERPTAIKQRMNLFYSYMDENNYKEANNVLTEIEAIVGTTDPDIAAARTSLDLEKILGE